MSVGKRRDRRQLESMKNTFNFLMDIKPHTHRSNFSTIPADSQVAQNELGEKCFASPAISEGQIFLRGERSLFCVGQRDEPAGTIR